jgi:hypothetical protein
MTEFFVVTNSNAAPFFSDKDEQFVAAETARKAADKARLEYAHPCGLYSLMVWQDANAYHKGEKHLHEWDSPKAKKDWK